VFGFAPTGSGKRVNQSALALAAPRTDDGLKPGAAVFWGPGTLAKPIGKH
jgi:hypothetical protein